MRLLKWVGAALALLVIVLFANMQRFLPDDHEIAAVELPDIDANAVAEKLSQAIQFKTISHKLGTPGRPDDYQQFLDWVGDAFPSFTAATTRDVVSGFTPIYHWKGSDPSAKAGLLSGHYDVVPIENEWTHDPWAGLIIDGVVWGRGTVDMKGGVITLLAALDRLAAEGFQPKQDLYVALTQDEEIGGEGGAQAVAAYMLENGIEIDWTMDEGSFVLRDMISAVDKDIAMINVSEKGYMTVKLTAKAEGGHSSMPQQDTAVSRLANAITALKENQIPGGLSGLAEETFMSLGPHMGFPEKLLFANRWLFGPLLESELSKANTTNALLRTTTAATMLEGSKAENVLPQAASVTLNFRLHPRDTEETVLQHIKDQIGEENFEIEVLKARAASPVGAHDNAVFQHIEATVRQVFGDVVTLPGLTIGGTDSSHYAALTDNSYRFLPFVATSEVVGLLHAKDERISVENLGLATQYYYLLVKGL